MRVWHVPLQLPTALRAQALTLLDATEHERAARFRFDLHRDRFIAAHAALRGILGEALGIPAADVALRTAASGKPALDGGQSASGLHFNLSHSGDHALVALSWGREVGVDIEEYDARDGRALDVLTQFSPLEQQALLALNGPARVRAFYRCWVRKEALLKAAGSGIAAGLERFSVSVGALACLLASDLPELSVGQWSLVALDAPGRWAAALAAPGEPPAVEMLRWTWA